MGRPPSDGLLHCDTRDDSDRSRSAWPRPYSAAGRLGGGAAVVVGQQLAMHGICQLAIARLGALVRLAAAALGASRRSAGRLLGEREPPLARSRGASRAAERWAGHTEGGRGGPQPAVGGGKPKSPGLCSRRPSPGAHGWRQLNARYWQCRGECHRLSSRRPALVHVVGQRPHNSGGAPPEPFVGLLGYDGSTAGG